MKKRKFAVLLPLLLLSLESCNHDLASDEVVKDISFTINKKTNEASVKGLNSSQKVVEIPNIVKIDGTSYNVTSIDKSAFASNTVIEKVIIPNNVKQIGDQSFARCTSLRYVSFGGAEKIDNFAFDRCSALVNVELPETLNYIGYGAFRNCSSMTDIFLPSNVTKLNGYTFSGDTKLRNVYANKLDSVSAYDFEKASSLKGLYYKSGLFSNQVNEKGNEYFLGLTANYGVNFEKENSDYYFVYDNETKTCDVSGYKKIDQTTFELPETTTFMGQTYAVDGIYEFAFYNSNATSIKLTKNIKMIGAYALYGSKITSFDTLEVNSIGSYAFANCEKLTNFNMADFVSGVQTYAFSSCTSLKDITLSKNLYMIQSNVFANCSELTSIVIKNTKMSQINDSAFTGCSKFKTIYFVGTEEEWSKITVSSTVTNGREVFCNHEI